MKSRAKLIYRDLKSRIDLSHIEPANEEIEELMLSGESETVEFKSTLRYDIRAGGVNKKLEYVVAKIIAAFLNSEGGNLFIGVDDNQNVLGLGSDIESLSKKNIDGFELHLVELIKKYIGGGFTSHIKIAFPNYDDTQICRVKIAKSGKPVFTIFEGREDFFIRSDCSHEYELVPEAA